MGSKQLRLPSLLPCLTGSLTASMSAIFQRESVQEMPSSHHIGLQKTFACRYNLKCSALSYIHHLPYTLVHTCTSCCTCVLQGKLSVINNYNNCLMQWLQEVFLGYLTEWEKSVQERPNFTALQKRKMLLSPETLLGLRITGMLQLE